MHTDEYEIALAKELAVCRQYLRATQKILRKLEEKYRISSQEFIRRRENGSFSADRADVTTWIDACESLATWGAREKAYEESYKLMKIS